MVGSLPRRNLNRFRGELVFKARRLCASLNCRRESNNEEIEEEKKKNPSYLRDGRLALLPGGWFVPSLLGTSS